MVACRTTSTLADAGSRSGCGPGPTTCMPGSASRVAAAGVSSGGALGAISPSGVAEGRVERSSSCWSRRSWRFSCRRLSRSTSSVADGCDRRSPGTFIPQLQSSGKTSINAKRIRRFIFI